jgi:ABC-2 type transport system ATP-binding protein
MDALSDTYTEVLVGPDHLEQAMSLNPIHSRDVIGKKSLIFTDVSKASLQGLGEVSTPSVTDLFVALLSRE